MDNNEFDRISSLDPRKTRIAKKNLYAWREEYAERNLIDAEHIRSVWLNKTQAERDEINRRATPIIAAGFRKAQELKRHR